MSLFNDLQSELIEEPKKLGNYRKILRKKKETEEEKEAREKREWKELCAQKKQEMSKEEFEARRMKEYYKRNRKERIKKQLKLYYNWKAEKRKQQEEDYWDIELVWTEEQPTDIDAYYTEKFKKDDIVRRGYRFSWWSSRLKRMDWRRIPKRKTPFRISNRRRLEWGMNIVYEKQIKCYNYLKPYVEQVRNCKYCLTKKQYPGGYPNYYMDEPLKTIAESGPEPAGRLVTILDWMLRDKFMVSELYLWRDSFIFWDMLVTWTWNTFRIALENNLPWLTPDTVEDIHEKRMKWRKEKADEAPPIYIVNDAYLIKVMLNETESLFYIAPT